MKNRKLYIIGFLFIFNFIILFAPFFAIGHTTPIVTDTVIELYSTTVSEVNVQYSVNIDFKNLIAIDAVRFKQDFKKVNKNTIKKLAKKFIKENKRKVVTKGKDGKEITREEIYYTVKDLDTVLDELGFTKEEKEQVHKFLQYGLGSITSPSDDCMGGMYNIPRFYQYDSRWASHPYGNSTIGRGGCGTTCFAMVSTGMNPKGLKNMDRNKDGILDPIEVSDWSANHGFKVSEGTSWGFFGSASKSIGLNITQFEKSNYNKVLKFLKDGCPVIVSVGPGHFTRAGHFIVLTGVDDKGKIIVNDPASEERSKKTWDFNSIIVPEAVQFWVFSKPLGASVAYNLTAYSGDPSENGGVAGRYGADGKTDLWKNNLKNRLIAVDPRKIKLGQKVYIKFPQSQRYVTLKNGEKFDLNGVYTAVDTGGDIKGNRIDLYTGYDGANRGFWYNLCNKIGRLNVTVYTDF